MSGDIRKRLGRKANVHYQRGLQLPRRAKLRSLQSVYTVGGFFVLTFLFSTLFVRLTEGANVTAPDRAVSIVSTKDKLSASPPISIMNKINQKNVLKAPRSILGGIVSSIPPKPAWVSMPLYTDPTNSAAQYAATHPTATGASYITRMSQVPVAQWFGDWNKDVQSDADSYVTAASAAHSVPVLVFYNIPHRDCGGYSVGGADDVSVYTDWVRKAATGIGDRHAVVVLEPDALGAVDCLPASLREDRYTSIAKAVTILKANPKTAVYIDAGTPVWQSTETMAARLQKANVAAAEGFSLNVSYFATTALNRAYGNELSSLIGYKHYVIDTSRNGGNHAVTGMQCNPSFASLGSTPTTKTGSALNDALLWIKIPWESDGPCNGAPGPGEGYWSYAISLAKNAGW